MQSASANDRFLWRIGAHFGRLPVNSPETAELQSVFVLAWARGEDVNEYSAVHRRKEIAYSRRAQMTAFRGG